MMMYFLQILCFLGEIGGLNVTHIDLIELGVKLYLSFLVFNTATCINPILLL